MTSTPSATACLRAPALIAFVKDTLIYIVIAVAIIYIPIKLGGFDEVFAGRSERKKYNRGAGKRAARWSRPRPANGRTPRWRWVPRSRCSCTRTRSRRRCPPGAVR